MKLSPAQQQVLVALRQGWTLKSHRYLNGRKTCRLYALTGETQTVRSTTVAALANRHLIDSNKKFPAETYILTETGRSAVAALARHGRLSGGPFDVAQGAR